MIIFLYGENSYKINKELRNILEGRTNVGAGQRTKYALKIFEEGRLDFNSVKSELETGSLFDDRKIVVLKNIFSDKNFKEEFFKNANGFLKSENVILVCQEGSIDKRDALFGFLLKEAECREFLPLQNRDLLGWIKKEFEGRKTKANLKAVEELVFYVGNDMWQLENEINKLSSYSEDSTVTEKEVRLLVKPKIDNDIFATIECLAQKNKEKALLLMQRHLEKGDSPLYILTMINFQLRNLLEVKDLMEKRIPYYDMAKKSGLHPFVVRKTYAQAQKFTLSQLKKIYQKMFQADLSIKTGKIEPETALDLLISRV